MSLQFRILGDLQVWRDDVLLELGGLRQRGVLAVLLVHSNSVVSAEAIAEALWPDDQPNTAIKTVQVYVSRLRQLFGEDRGRIASLPAGYQLTVAPEELDATQFDSLAAEGIRLGEGGDHKAAAAKFTDALQLWRSEALTDFRYESFAAAWIAQLEERRLEVEERRFMSLFENGEDVSLIGPLRNLIDGHPLSERLWVILVRALYRAGRQAEALEAVRRVRGVLLDELGLDPGPELQQLELAVLNQDKLLAAKPRSRSQLPLELSSFHGREAELVEISSLLEEHRLVTLTGPGGIGKTRLALRVARLVEPHFGDGVRFVDLSAVRDPQLVMRAIASALGLRDSSAELTEASLVTYLGDRHLLLVVDNLEQVIDAGAALGQLLAASPQLHMITTSRMPLRIRGEQQYEVLPLSTTASDGTDPAAELFVSRAQEVDVHFAPANDELSAVREICLRLDGLPLAIELAAARTRILGVKAILVRLEHRLSLLTSGERDAPDRHQTLSAAIDWSYELLQPDAKRLFEQASAFSGGFSVEAALSICEVDGDSLELLTILVESSLLRRVPVENSGSRFEMLETVREFAANRLGSGGAEVAARHAHFYAALVDGASGDIQTSKQLTRLRELDLEQGNLRHAIGTLRGLGPAMWPEMVGEMWRYWRARGANSEALDLLNAAIAVSTDGLRGRLLTGRSAIHSVRDETRAALSDLDEAQSLLSSQDDVDWRCEGLIRRAIALYSADPKAAPTVARSAVALAEKTGSHWLIGFAWNVLGWTFDDSGKYPEAEAAWIRSRDEFQMAGDRVTELHPKLNLISLQLRRGELDLAEAGLAHAQLDARELRERAVLVTLAELEATLLRSRGELGRALDRALHFTQLATDLGDPTNIRLGQNLTDEIRRDLAVAEAG